jgi:two-component SAPR family response regulator
MLEGVKQSVKQILPEASIVAFTSADEAMGFVRESGCDVLISEIELCGLDGLTLAQRVKKINPRVNIIFFTVLRSSSAGRSSSMATYTSFPCLSFDL